MLSLLKSGIENFFERNLFERLVIYIFLSFLLTKGIFEFALAQDGYRQSQNQQWIFYGFLALDYLASIKKIINIKITINPMSIFAFILFIMIGHGLFIGILNHNQPFIILNDTIPLLMIALNILRMQSITEIQKPIDFKFLITACILIVSIMYIFGFLVDRFSIGSIAIFYPLVVAGFIMFRPFPKWLFILAVIILVIGAADMNRTTLLFFAFVVLGYIGVNMVYKPTRSFLVILTVIISLFAAWHFLPEDSRTRGRIIGLTEIDLTQRTGSIGERQAEQDAVALKLEKAGPTAEWVGSGFGGVYDVRFTHEFYKDYGHAHYAWVWFNLRYGKIGLIYMAILIFMLSYNGIQSFKQRDEVGLFVALMCLMGLIYILTHVNSILLLMGLQFIYLRQINDITKRQKS